MNLSELNKEIEDLVLQSVRSRTVRFGVRVFDPLPLAEAWLRGEEREWVAMNGRAIPDEELPSARLRGGNSPFSSGQCVTYGLKGRSTVYLQPAFDSPGSARHWGGGAANPMRSFDRLLGMHRFAALHEIGHWVAENAGISSFFRETPKDLLVSEAVADGFALAWSVARGADPQETIRDVGVYRACSAIQHLSSEYLTLGALEPAAEIGLRFRRWRNDSAWQMIDEIHSAAIRHLPAKEFIGEISGKSWEDLQPLEEAKPIVSRIRKYAAMQEPWSHEDEDSWWKEMQAANPEHAKTLPLIQTACGLSTAAAEGNLGKDEKPYSPRAIFRMLKRAAAVEGGERWADLEAALPEENSRESWVRAFDRAAEIFAGQNEMMIRDCLDRIARHTETCSQDPDVRDGSRSGPVPGIDQPVCEAILIEGRKDHATEGWLPAVSDRISGSKVKHIAVIAESERESKAFGSIIRAYGDSMLAEIHAMPPEKLKERREKILLSAGRGTLSIFGNVPELDAREKARPREKCAGR